MKNVINDLYEKFLIIKNYGWIKSKRPGNTGVGYTFEELINKPEENFSIPDFNGIEIKTYRKFSRQKIHLFNATPDGDFLFPIKRILSILGYPDRNNSSFKVFNMSFNAEEYTSIGYYKKAKLLIDRKNSKISLLAFNNNGKNLDVDVSWSFELLREKLYTKMEYLAIVMACSKYIKGQEFFNYNKINFYHLKSFDKFLDLLENGTIFVTFKIGVFKSGKRMGQIHDRGTDFSIKLEDIDKLYSEIVK